MDKPTLLFVYGTLKKGYHNHYLMQASGMEFVNDAQTLPRYDMFGNGFPILFENENGHPVTGELYAFDIEDQLCDIDQLENGYDRKEISVVLRDGSTRSAYIYVGRGRNWWVGAEVPPRAEDGIYEWVNA